MQTRPAPKTDRAPAVPAVRDLARSVGRPVDHRSDHQLLRGLTVLRAAIAASR